jgi:hypothetical protein
MKSSDFPFFTFLIGTWPAGAAAMSKSGGLSLFIVTVTVTGRATALLEPAPE